MVTAAAAAVVAATDAEMIVGATRYNAATNADQRVLLEGRIAAVRDAARQEIERATRPPSPKMSPRSTARSDALPMPTMPAEEMLLPSSSSSPSSSFSSSSLPAPRAPAAAAGLALFSAENPPAVVTTPTRDVFLDGSAAAKERVSTTSAVPMSAASSVAASAAVAANAAIPLLDLDIKVPSGKKEKLVVYPNDVAEDVAREFAAQHGLEVEKETKLCKVIRASLAMYAVRTQTPG